MKVIKVLLIITFLSGCTTGVNRSEDIVTQLKSGDKAYFNNLFSSSEYDTLLDKIERGDEILIRSSYLFLPWIDASTSLSLKYSLSRALIKKPNAVMNLVPKYFSVTDICTIPYIEEPINVELNHINSSIIALKELSGENINRSVVECIRIYEEFKKNITSR